MNPFLIAKRRNASTKRFLFVAKEARAVCVVSSKPLFGVVFFECPIVSSLTPHKELTRRAGAVKTCLGAVQIEDERSEAAFGKMPIRISEIRQIGYPKFLTWCIRTRILHVEIDC